MNLYTDLVTRKPCVAFSPNEFGRMLATSDISLDLLMGWIRSHKGVEWSELYDEEFDFQHAYPHHGTYGSGVSFPDLDTLMLFKLRFAV